MVSATVLLLMASSLGVALGHDTKIPIVPQETHTDPPYGPPGQFLSRVRPRLGSTVFDVTSSKYGAIGNNRTDDTKALQSALDDCVKSGDGGVVLLPSKASNTEAAVGSVYLSYPLFLDDATGCAIVLAPRATLFAKAWTGPAPPIASTPRSAAARQRRVDLMRSDSDARVGEPLSTKVSFLNIDNCRSCAIGGGGTIDGNGPAWWFNKSAFRPKLIGIDHSRDFALWNFTATDGGDHTIELGADDVEVAHMEIVMDWTKALPPGLLGGIMAPNTDGIDVHGTPFYVHHTHIDVGDDNVAVHASDVLVEDCHFGGDAVGHGEPHGHGASIGSIGGGTKLQNITFRRIFFENTHVGPNIKIHGDATDGYVRDVVYEDLVIFNATLENLFIHADYPDEGRLAAAPTPPTKSGNSGSAFTVSNVLFKNITATGTYKQGGFSCSEKVKCENITMIDVHTDGKADSYVCKYTTGSAKDVSPPIPCLHSYS